MHPLSIVSIKAKNLLLLLAFLLAACRPTAAPAPTATLAPAAAPTHTPMPSDTPAPTSTPLPTQTPAPQLSFEAATYQDKDAGFEFDYPSTWTVDPPQIGGGRGYIIQFTSWPHAPGDISAETPPGGTRMDVNVLLWDRKNDLDAYIAVRKQAWSASGFDILSEEESTLAGDWRAVRFRIQAPEEQAFFLITTLGERYLVLSGSGDLGLLDEISRTLRLLAAGQ